VIPQSQEGSAGLQTGCREGVPARARPGATTKSTPRNTLRSNAPRPFLGPAPAQPITSGFEPLPQAPRQARFPPTPRPPRRANPRTWETHVMPTPRHPFSAAAGESTSLRRERGPSGPRTRPHLPSLQARNPTQPPQTIPQSQEGSAGLQTGCREGVPARARPGATTKSSPRNTPRSNDPRPFLGPAPAQPITSGFEPLPQAPSQARFPPTPRPPRRANSRTWEAYAMPTFRDRSTVNERIGDLASFQNPSWLYRRLPLHIRHAPEPLLPRKHCVSALLLAPFFSAAVIYSSSLLGTCSRSFGSRATCPSEKYFRLIYEMSHSSNTFPRRRLQPTGERPHTVRHRRRSDAAAGA